jgi:mannitol/fructose-specific phosphotransferase system IIA component (Ntr-type)
MINLIENHGFYMYMGSGTLLLHAKPTDGVNQLCISMLRLSKPFHFADSRIPDFDLIFVLGATDDHSHLTALFQLNEIIQFPEFMHKLRRASKPSEIVHYLWEWTPQLSEDL